MPLHRRAISLDGVPGDEPEASTDEDYPYEYDSLCSCSECLLRRELASWTETADQLPPNDLVVETKIHDDDGPRNVQPLKRRGHLWFFEDGSMYVYYQPTHWRPM